MGNPHAGFDEAGAGDGLSGTAPAFDPTCWGGGAKFPCAIRQNNVSIYERRMSDEKKKETFYFIENVFLLHAFNYWDSKHRIRYVVYFA